VSVRVVLVGAGGCRSGEQGSAGSGAVASTSGGSARTGADGRATCRVSPVSSAESVEQPLARSPTSGSWIEFVPTPADTMPGGRSSGRPPPDAALSRGCLGRELLRRLRATVAARAVARPHGAGSARADGVSAHTLKGGDAAPFLTTGSGQRFAAARNPLTP